MPPLLRFTRLSYWLLFGFGIIQTTLPCIGAPFVYSSAGNFIVTADFNGDARSDIAIVDKENGGVRFGYGTPDGAFNWVSWRSSGFTRVSSVAAGRFLGTRADSLAFAAHDSDFISLIGGSEDDASILPTQIRWSPKNSKSFFAVHAINRHEDTHDELRAIGLLDSTNATRVASQTYCISTFKNYGEGFSQIRESLSESYAHQFNRIKSKQSGKDFYTYFLQSATFTKPRLAVGELIDGDIIPFLTTPEIPNSGSYNANYLFGHFRDVDFWDFVFYGTEGQLIRACSINEVAGKFQVGETKTFTFPQQITQLLSVDGHKCSGLLALFGETLPIQLFSFDTTTAPVAMQSLETPKNVFPKFAVPLSNSFVVFSTETPSSKYYISRERAAEPLLYQTFQLGSDGHYAATTSGHVPGYNNDYAAIPKIHDRVVGSQKEKTEADMQSYTNTIPGTELSYQMSAIPGGEFVMGSPPTENKRADDEGPQHRVKISPFWMGQHEVTWKEFQMFVYQYDEQKMRAKYPTSDEVNQVSDAVTRPSKPYIDMSSGMGMKKGQPAIAMTQHAANKYCQWLSAKTGHFYRLPTEAEWEYAARAGTTKAYFFGNDLTDLSKYAWYYGLQDTDSAYHKIGQKLPNPWGLYDISGNVAEWVLDQYDESFYKMCADGGVVTDPWNKAVRPYPHSVRGGSFDDNPDKLRSAARFKSTPMWKESYPDLPKTIWWLTDNKTVGFRIVRPLKIPSAEEMASYWNNGVEKD